MWYVKYGDDGNYWFTEGDNDDKFFRWYDGYKKRKSQKTKIKEELLPLSWYLGVSLRMGKEIHKNCGHKYGLFLYPVTKYKNILTKQNCK